MAELYGNWTKTIQEDITKKKELLASTETTEQKAALEKEIAALEQTLLDKEDLLTGLEQGGMASQSTSENATETGSDQATTASSTTNGDGKSKEVVLNDQAIEKGIALPAVNEEGTPIDYDAAYTAKLSDLTNAETTPGQADRIATVNELWAETIRAEIEIKQKSLKKEKDKNKKEAIESEINALLPLAEEKLAAATQARSGGALANTSTESPGTNKETSEGSLVSIDSEQLEQLKKEPTAITDNSGAIIPYQAYYEDAYEQAIAQNDEAKLAAIDDKWSKSQLQR